MNLEEAIANARAHLLSLRNDAGHWEGDLSSSALSTATAILALELVDPQAHHQRTLHGVEWLLANQDADGGWGDTPVSRPNLSTTLLCWSAISMVLTRIREHGPERPDAVSSDGFVSAAAGAIERCEDWIRQHAGSLEPDAIRESVIARYGKDRTFSVPILMTCALAGRLGDPATAWLHVPALPFELAALPRAWFGLVGLPVVSYALPALIAIGHARFHHAPPPKWNPLSWMRRLLWPRVSPMLRKLQPETGGYLEATPLTSFVVMALAGADHAAHPCVPPAVAFLERSQRADGSWAIDTNLATWVTTLSVKALLARSRPSARTSSGPAGETADREEETARIRAEVRPWLLAQQYKTVHPFTLAAAGGWAWTDLPGGVPDADDTSGALVALWRLCESDGARREIQPAVEAGIRWLLNLQNRDGGMPTFCRGWSALPFDRSTPEITAHALWAFALWRGQLGPPLRARIDSAAARGFVHLQNCQKEDGSWVPLWFGNEAAPDHQNPVHGTSSVLTGLAHAASSNGPTRESMRRAMRFLFRCQHPDGAWGGAAGVAPSIEETACAVHALAVCAELGSVAEDLFDKARDAVQRGTSWLLEHTRHGAAFPPAPIGLYFARLWYHESLYPVAWTLSALERATAFPENPDIQE